MKKSVLPICDPEASGPRDSYEYAELRDAHRIMKHFPLRDLLDTERVNTLTRLQRAAYTAGAIAKTAYAAHEHERLSTTCDPVVLDNLNRALDAATLAAGIAVDRCLPWPLDPCPAPRCTGHAAVLDVPALRRLARAARPITPAMRKRAVELAPGATPEESAA